MVLHHAKGAGAPHCRHLLSVSCLWCYMKVSEKKDCEDPASALWTVRWCKHMHRLGNETFQLTCGLIRKCWGEVWGPHRWGPGLGERREAGSGCCFVQCWLCAKHCSNSTVNTTDTNLWPHRVYILVGQSGGRETKTKMRKHLVCHMVVTTLGKNKVWEWVENGDGRHSNF